jgi:hypothetical protein
MKPLWLVVGLAGALLVPAQSVPEITDTFQKAVQEVFEKAKAAPDKDAASLFRDLLEQGADRMVSERRTSNRDLGAATKLAREFAQEMVKNGERRPGSKVTLTEKSFSAAQKALCPLYPFC